jgi:hypothetical protein
MQVTRRMHELKNTVNKEFDKIVSDFMCAVLLAFCDQSSFIESWNDNRLVKLVVLTLLVLVQ